MNERMIRGALVSLTAVSMLALPGGAALGQGVSPPTPVSGAITVWSWDVAAAALQRLAADFTAANPGTTVDVVDVGYDNAYDKITVGLGAGAGLPDLVTVETDHMQPYVTAFPEGFLDLTDRASGLQDQFDPSKWAASSDQDGRLFSLPWDSGTVGLFCRSDYLQQAGVDPASLATWDDFVAAGDKVKEAVGVPMINVDVNGSDGIYAELLQQLGTGYFTPDGRIAVAGPESVQAMTLLKTLNERGLIDNRQGWDARVTAAKRDRCLPCHRRWWNGTLTIEAAELPEVDRPAPAVFAEVAPDVEQRRLHPGHPGHAPTGPRPGPTPGSRSPRGQHASMMEHEPLPGLPAAYDEPRSSRAAQLLGQRCSRCSGG